MSDLTAIDALINPDEATIKRAREISPAIIKWVEAFVPAQIGEGNYSPTSPSASPNSTT
jgi:hypothetical protein